METIRNEFSDALNLVFINGVVMNQLHPDTFYVPSEDSKKNIKVGDFIKIGLRNKVGGNAERFWVIVNEVEPGVITGTVDNDLVIIDLDRGEEIIVPIDAVLDIMS